MMHVICFYWQGDRWQQNGYEAPEGHINDQQATMDKLGIVDDDLPAKYVNNLYNGVKRFADREFKFICFTNEKLDVQEGIELRPFEFITLDGVLPRLYMFSEAAGLFGNQVLCLDLDVVITGSLNPLMEYNGLFCTRSKFKPSEKHKLDGDIMSFKASAVTEKIFWKKFIEDKEAAEKLTMGRERYWVRHVAGDIADRWDDIAPGSVLSYKWHVQRKEKVPEGTSIISCHGIPRPHQIKDNWIKEYWQ